MGNLPDVKAECVSSIVELGPIAKCRPDVIRDIPLFRPPCLAEFQMQQPWNGNRNLEETVSTPPPRVPSVVSVKVHSTVCDVPHIEVRRLDGKAFNEIEREKGE